MSITCDKTILLVPSSRSSVKVKVEYKNHNIQKNVGGMGGIVFYKHIFFERVKKSKKNIVGKGENANCYHFLLLP